MTLGDILEVLKESDVNMPIRISDGTYVRDEFGSDRGSYYNMYIGYNMQQKDDTIKTVGELIDLLERAKKQGTMVGYKGGDFDIDDWTTVTIGSYGLSGNEVYDTAIKNGTFYLVVGEYKFIEKWHD